MFWRNQRNSERFSTIWKVFTRKTAGQNSLIGYIMDISQHGARFFVKDISPFQSKAGNKLTIHIQPDLESLEKISADVSLSWCKTWQEYDGAYEVGVNFAPQCQLDLNYLKILGQEFHQRKRAVAQTVIEYNSCDTELSKVESELAQAFVHSGSFTKSF